MNRLTMGAAALCLLVAACGGKTGTPTPSTPTAPPTVAESAIDSLLLAPAVLNQVMGTTGLTAKPPIDHMDDHRNMLPNLNCLGVWQIDEAQIYGKTYTAVRQQTLRVPDTDQWDSLVAQSVVYYPTAAPAREFFDESAERWSKCTNHHVNITLNGKPLPKWLSGDLGRTDTQLTMPITRGTGDQTRWCQHVLRLAGNLVIDVEACAPKAGVTAAAELADKIEAAIH
ncbi:hypothetical protein ABIA30_003137 [Mycobacterium sp. MAA66]|uniref:sensor domain-containing protein n=1 Tax=Mycobacterium sp. MAA66 TaxID=3156297 RepID=UPI00351228FF